MSAVHKTIQNTIIRTLFRLEPICSQLTKIFQAHKGSISLALLLRMMSCQHRVIFMKYTRSPLSRNRITCSLSATDASLTPLPQSRAQEHYECLPIDGGSLLYPLLVNLRINPPVVMAPFHLYPLRGVRAQGFISAGRGQHR